MYNGDNDMEELRYVDGNIRYTIIRTNKETSEVEYLDNCMILGRDDDGILKVRNDTWANVFHVDNLTTNLEFAVRQLDGVKKYCNDERYNHSIRKIITEYVVSDI